MHDFREDAQIIIAKRGRLVMCGRAIYFRRDELNGLVSANRFVAGSPSQAAPVFRIAVAGGCGPG
jgi:hypothetical protein